MVFNFTCGEETAALTLEESEGKVYATMLTSTGPGALRKVWRFVLSVDVPLYFAFTGDYHKLRKHVTRKGAEKVMEVWRLGE